MFGRIFIYKFKALIRSHWLIGWNFLFPLVLATAFSLGFGNLIDDDPISFHTMDVGYVAEEDSTFLTVLETLSKSTDEREAVINLHTYNSEKNAKQALADKEIDGYYLLDSEDIHTTVSENGIVSTTLLQIVKDYKNFQTTIKNIAIDHPENLESAVELMGSDLEIIKQHSFGHSNSPYLQYFYALLTMTSLFGSWISTFTLQGMCANMSERGKRFECAPGHKFKAIAAGTLAGILIQSASNAVLVIYIVTVLKIDLGLNLGLILLITTLGSALGITAGTFMGALLKKPVLLVAVPMTYAMLCSFFSGLMVASIKQYVQYYVPFLNKINPGAVMSDSLYIASNYGLTREFYQDITIMIVIIIIHIILSGVILRRRNYASI